MDLNVHVKVELVETPALINCFDAFCSTLEKCMALLNSEQAAVVPAPVLPVPQKEPEPIVAEAPKIDKKAPDAPVEKPKEPGPKKYTLDDFRKACAPMLNTDAGVGGKIKAIIESYGVHTMPEIPEEKYPEFVEKLRALGAKL